jgi:hypothetical protein
MKAKINLLKVRNFERNMNVTVEFLKQNYLNILKSILIFIPFMLIPTYFLYNFQGNLLDIATSAFEFDFVNYILGLTTMYIISQMAFIFITAYMVVYSQSADGKVDISIVWEKTKDSALPLIGGFFIYMIAIVLGSILLIIPGIIIAIHWSFFTYVYIAEGKSVFGSFSRSSQLVKNNWWKIFGFCIVAILVGSIISSTLSLPFSLTTVLVPIVNGNTDIITNSTFLAFTTFFSSVAGLVSMPISAVAVGVMYYSRITDVDKIDIEHQIELLGTIDDQE